MLDRRSLLRVIREPDRYYAAYHDDYRSVVRSYYDLVTASYRKNWGESFHFALFSAREPLRQAMLATERRLAEEAGLQAGQRVLDVGCGVGGPALNIAEYSGAHVTGINIHEGQLAIARQQAERRRLNHLAEFVQADAMAMPFPDASFDAIYIFEAGCHMPDKPRFYRECWRVLKPGWVFLGQDWMRKDDLTAEEQQSLIEPICRLYAVRDLIGLEALGRCLVSCGFKVERLENAADRYDILRNWEILDTKIVRNLQRWALHLLPPTLRLMTEGGLALLQGARQGAFIIGCWCARK